MNQSFQQNVKQLRISFAKRSLCKSVELSKTESAAILKYLACQKNCPMYLIFSSFKRKNCNMGKEIKCENDYIKSCNDKKNGYKGFTRKCEGIPISKCHEVKLTLRKSSQRVSSRYPQNPVTQLMIQDVT